MNAHYFAPLIYLSQFMYILFCSYLSKLSTHRMKSTLNNLYAWIEPMKNGLYKKDFPDNKTEKCYCEKMGCFCFWCRFL